jgi:predicted deacylase
MLVVLGAVHGDEYEGVEAIPQVFAEIDPAALAGTLVMVPVCNLPAYEAALRNSPIDSMNLARVFPGRADGTVTERIAHALTEQLLRHADFLLDLHSGGVAYDIPTLVGYIHDDGELGQRSQAAAKAFGAPVMWGHPLPMPPGRSLSAAVALGVPCLYTEAHGGGTARIEDVACFQRGTLNLMRHLGMVAGAPNPPEQPVHLVGDGNLDVVTLAPAGGYFRPSVALLDTVQRGEPLGNIFDLFGKTLATITAEADGIVIMLRRLHRVHVGEGLVQVTNTLEDYLLMLHR